MEYYLAIKKNKYMKFLGKWMDLEGIILSEVTQSQKKLKWYVLTDKWILAQKLNILRYKVHYAKHMKLKKNEDQSMVTLPFLELGTKHPW